MASGREPAPDNIPGLASVFQAVTPPRSGGLRVGDAATSGVRDTNGDGWADDIVARVIVPAAPSPGDVEAATNIAARLGFETMAATLPIVVRDSDVGGQGEGRAIGFPVLVGRGNAFVRKLVEAGTVDLAALQPGQGLVAAVRSPLGGPDGVLVAGPDDEGTVAAAVELAARLPRLWSMTGITLHAIEEQTTTYLRGKGVGVSSAVVTAVVVDRERRGIAAVRVRARLEQADAAERAIKALKELDGAHRRGLEPRTLNFANAAETQVELVASGGGGGGGGGVIGRAVVRRAGLNPRTLTPPIDPDELASDSPGERGRPAEAPQAGASKTFDLTDLYSLSGWLGDGYSDLIPDRLDTVIVPGRAADALGAAHIAARLGLETTGITLPLTKVAGRVREASREPSPILVGRDHPLVADLVKVGKVRLDDLTPGDGLVQAVPRAFGHATATVVTGADARGTEAASLYVARRAPYVWNPARGSIALGDVATDVARFLQARTGAGQASQMIRELDGWPELKDRATGSVATIEATLFVETGDAKLETFIADRIQAAVKAPVVKVKSVGITDPVPVFEETIDVPWEVDDFRARLKAEVLPRVTPGAAVELEARLSESPEVRRALESEVRAALTAAGAVNPQVRILSAYKQGFLWLTEQVIPSLKGKSVRSVRIQVARRDPDLSKKYKFYELPTRWVHELYPVDEIFTRDLGIAPEAFHLELVDAPPGAGKPQDIYTLEALDAAGRVVQRAAFSPKTVEREYLDRFPGWSRVTVTTGWISASVNGTSILDARIATDPERFWDHYQANVLPRMYDHVMKVTDQQPLPDKQPFHRDLDIEVWMSEPDFRIGLDEELISSLESLHEDLYFVTLDFFDALGRTTVRRRLAGPGKIFPIIHPDRPGRPGQVRILYAGNASTKPKLELSYTAQGSDRPIRTTREIAKIELTNPAAEPQVLRAVVTTEAIKELELAVEVKDDREAARAADAWDVLAALHAAGLYRTALSYDQVGTLALAIATKEARTRRVLAYTGAARSSPVHRAPQTSRASARQGGTDAGDTPPRPLIAWDHVISPEESERLIAALAAYPEIHAYRAGRSYRGRDTSVMEVLLPNGGELLSRAKATAWKPTIFITGRQHANEVSSTSHILRLAELLATDPSYRAILQKVNVILHPVENPDGAAMAYELQQLTPTHMLHAGRYSALGMDVAAQVGLPDPLLPESRVRGTIWRAWLPDIYLNPHGYPSHEWVQQFAGYVPPGFRSYWSSRGWYTVVSALRDPRYPDHARAVETIRDQIVREVNSDPDVRAMNLRHQARYRRWAHGFAPAVFGQEIYKDTAIYYTDPESGQPSGARRAGPRGANGPGGGPPSGNAGRDFMGAWPQVTWFDGMTEAPDETAQGRWLDLVTKPGFGFLMASLRYLQHGEIEVQRLEENGPRDAATITMFRPRPVKPGRMPLGDTAARR